MSNEPKAGMNLDPEMLAAYIDKRLSPEQRAAVEAQLATDPDSYAVLVETIKALDEVQVPEVRTVPEVPEVPEVPKGRVPGAQRWWIAAGALAAAAMLVVAVRLGPSGVQQENPRLERLVAAVGDERYVEGRLTGGFHYGPRRTVTRGPGGSNDNLALRAAVGELEQLAQSNPQAEALHAVGVAQLLEGRHDQAIENLTRAAGLGQSAAILNDLSAAYASRAESTNDAGDWQRALQYASDAVAGSASPAPEALFNRALAASRLSMPSAAGYWQTYVDTEENPDWKSLGERYLNASRSSGPPR
jgi:tetratricopeptide (TPR) repeat protein